MRKHEDLKKAYNDAAEKNKNCNTQLDAANAENKQLKDQNYIQEKDIARLKIDSSENSVRLIKTREDLDQLQNSYETLLKNTEKQNQRLDRDLKDLETKLNKKEVELNKKEQDLADKEKSINDLQLNLKQKESRVNELQSILNSKDSAVNALKNSLTKALLGYKDQGLTVTVKNGKVYVSMDEKLLFASGSIVVDKKGKEALLEFAKAINSQKDVGIMIEGHTDNVPIKSGQIKDNWDLSVLRATSILRFLTEDGKIDPTRIIASGRGEYLPVAENKSAENRAKNRRTEIILTPKLDELFEILGN
jgi:chemotaxis protein MotB